MRRRPKLIEEARAQPIQVRTGSCTAIAARPRAPRLVWSPAIGLDHDFVPLSLGLGQFGFDLFSVSQEPADLPLPDLRSILENGLVGEPMKKRQTMQS